MGCCKNCGEYLEGDGYTVVLRCPSSDDWWDAAPDEGPFYCKPDVGEGGLTAAGEGRS